MRHAVSVVVAVVGCLWTSIGWGAELGRAIENFSLADSRNQQWSLVRENAGKLTVVAFLGTECPLAKAYGPKLARMANEYRDRKVDFVAINSNSQDSLAEVAAYARQSGFTFPMLKDPGNKVADQFGAERTPEVFLLDEQRVVRYHGRIDDQFAIGVMRDNPKRRDLAAAIDELLAGKPVSVAKTDVVGCHIGRIRSPKPNAAITFSKHIAPLLNRRCVECHREGDIGPFSLTKYEEVVGWAEMIDEVVDQGRMPPWHADPQFGKFAEDRRLTTEEKNLVREWVRAGAPQGDPNDLPPVPKFPSATWQLGTEPDLVVSMSSKPFVVRAEGELRYQYFEVDSGITSERWIRAAEVMPGSRAVVHHALVMERNGDNGRGPDGFLAAYVPGLRAKEYPTGMAKRMTPGSKLVFQMHYTPNGTEQSDITKIGLWFADPEKVTHQVRTVSAATHNFEIPPHAANHKVEARSAGAPAGTLLLSFMPHMHLRGKAFRYELVSGKEATTLLDIPHYDFNWQTAYRLTEPVSVPAGAFVKATAHFDNSADNLSNPNPAAKVRWGDQTYEEMMIGYMDIATPRDGAAPVRGAAGTVGRGELIQRLDRNNDGKISRDEVPDRLLKIFDRLANGKDSLPVDELQKLVDRARS